jgi:hypothetical protein
MSQARIRAAFESRLAIWAQAQGLPVVWQNAPGELPTVDHLRAFVLPAETQSIDLERKFRNFRGVFQVSVFTRAGQGAGRAEQLARALDELFPVAAPMVFDGLTVRTTSPMSARPAIQETDWYSVPVSCRYGADEVLSI